MTGYWFLDEPEGWAPPADLQAFLEAGELPVAVTLGAMSLGGGADALGTVRLVLDGIHRAGVRAVVQGWDGVMQSLELPDTVHHAGAVPHRWLFDRVACVVHHGGFGTTAAALRAGVPAVVVPHVIDQTFWARRVHNLGVGPPPIPRARLTAERLAEALVQAIQDEGMRVRAAHLGAQIRAEDGIGEAVRLVENGDLSPRLRAGKSPAQAGLCSP